MNENSVLEQLLLCADNRTGNPEICKALEEIYSGKKPITAFAYAMKAQRLGAADIHCSELRNAALRSPAEEEAFGCYILAKELCCRGRDAEAIAYLQVAARGKDPTVAGCAALYLADLLAHAPEHDSKEAYFWYRRAAELGNPDVLS